IAGRVGGEEFAIILPETTSEKAIEVAERLREVVAKVEMTVPLHLTVSIGVTTLKNKDTNIDMLLNQADKALYEAKETGRNKVCVG
ncbi:MAG TPA: GGDEF domain-containing protein, partial [Methylotenera sp.]|nr:GGDEF domain-containing protein [Methylotenera sp.]